MRFLPPIPEQSPPMSSNDLQDSKSNALVPRPGTGLAEVSRRTNPVIARMTRDVLARAQAQALSAARFRIGEYLLREPDYRQMLEAHPAFRTGGPQQPWMAMKTSRCRSLTH